MKQLKESPMWVKISIFMAIFIIVYLFLNWNHFWAEFSQGLEMYGIKKSE